GAVISGAVTRDSGAAPVLGAWVSCASQGGEFHTEVSTDASGRYACVVEPGAYNVSVLGGSQYFWGTPDLDTLPREVTVPEDQLDINFDLTTVRLSGSVWHECLGQPEPVANATLWCYPNTRSRYYVGTEPITTGADGRFSLALLVGKPVGIVLEAESGIESPGQTAEFGSAVVQVPPDPTEAQICIQSYGYSIADARVIVGFKYSLNRALFESYGGLVYEPTTQQ